MHTAGKYGRYGGTVALLVCAFLCQGCTTRPRAPAAVPVSPAPSTRNLEDTPLSQALKGLGAKYLYEREEAARKLTAMGHEVLPHVIRAAKSEDFFTRTSALQVIGPVARKGDEEPLGDLLRSSRYSEVRRGVARILGDLGGDIAAGYLQSGIYDNDPTVRETCARWLGRLRWKPAATRVRELLKDESPKVRAAACKAIGLMGDEASRSQLIKLLGDPFPEVRLAAISALGRLGSQGALNLMDLALNGVNKQERIEALRSLGAGGGDAAAQTCSQVLVTASDPDVVEAARAALSGMGESASKALRQVVSESDLGKRVIAEQRAASVGLPAVPALLSVLEVDPYDRLRDAASKHLAKITGKDFGYRYDAPEEKQKEALEAWKKWWEERKPVGGVR